VTETMIPDEPSSNESRWFRPVSGGLNDEPQGAEPAVPRLVESPSAEPLPKRPVGKHRAERHGAGAAQPTRDDLRALSAVVSELHQLVSSASATVKDSVEQHALQDEHAERALMAAQRVSRGHLALEERAAIAAVFKAYSTMPVNAVLHGPLLVTLEAAVIKLTAPRAELPATNTASAAAVRDGAE
jgi:hypothetical protein